MGKIEHALPVKPFIGLITNAMPLMEKMKGLLRKKFGEIDFESDVFNFDFTTYYDEEMGRGLKRKFLSFKRLISPERIGVIKIFTNRLEGKFSMQGKRRINIDPGYISLSKLVLLTTKDYYHRIYLGKGLYAEVTLHYKNKTFQPFEWSYPDYKSKGYLEFFNKVRACYFAQVRESGC